MKPTTPDPSTHAAIQPADQGPIDADRTGELEQQMAELDLSAADKLFLRALHQTEKQLNEAFEAAQQSGDLQQQVSRVYRQLYRPD